MDFADILQKRRTVRLFQQKKVEKDAKTPAKDIRIQQAAECINNAERPFIYFGGGAEILEKVVALLYCFKRKYCTEKIIHSRALKFFVHLPLPFVLWAVRRTER